MINWNPISETWSNLMQARGNQSVFLSLMGISWLWFFGSAFLTTFTAFAKDVLGGDQNIVTLERPVHGARIWPLSKVAAVVGVPVPAAQASPQLLQERVAQLRGGWK